MNKNVVLILAILVVLGLVAFSFSMQSGGGAVTEPVELGDLVEDPQQLAALAQGVTMGDADAPVTIVEFGDYQCPGCGGFAGSVKPQIELAWVESGQARFVFYDFPLTSIHPHAFLAARAARCAGDQGLYWEYHDALFRNQSRWSPSPRPPVGQFVDYAAEVGLDQGDFESCVESAAHAETVTANMLLGEQLGITGTPSVLVSSGDGSARRVGDPNFGAIQQIVDGLLAGSAGAAGSEAADTAGSR